MEVLKLCEGCGVATQLKHFRRKRSKEIQKTCNNCRNNKNNNIQSIDKELRNKFEIEINVNTNDKSIKNFTFEEQVERYTKSWEFWKNQLPCELLNDVKDDEESMRWLLIKSTMSDLLMKIDRLDDNLRKEIRKNIF